MRAGVPIVVPGDITGKARQYYRMGYRDGLKGWAVICGSRKYGEVYWRGYEDGFKAAGHTEVKPFEKGRGEA